MEGFGGLAGAAVRITVLFAESKSDGPAEIGGLRCLGSFLPVGRTTAGVETSDYDHVIAVDQKVERVREVVKDGSAHLFVDDEKLLQVRPDPVQQCITTAAKPSSQTDGFDFVPVPLFEDLAASGWNENESSHDGQRWASSALKYVQVTPSWRSS